jgi:hypothetical protein
MASKVFGQWTSGEPPAPTAEHFAYRKLEGEKTICGVKLTSRTLSTLRIWKDPKMVTCQKCRKALGQA